MRAACTFAAAALIGLCGCAKEQAAGRPAPSVEECRGRPDCFIVAFTGFRGEEAELFLNGESVFREVLQTPDWSTEYSGGVQFVARRLDHARLTIDGKTVFDQPIDAPDAKTVYVTSREPYVWVTNHPTPMLD